MWGQLLPVLEVCLHEADKPEDGEEDDQEGHLQLLTSQLAR